MSFRASVYVKDDWIVDKNRFETRDEAEIYVKKVTATKPIVATCVEESEDRVNARFKGEQLLRPNYPEFCRHPVKCIDGRRCMSEFCCAD